MKKTAQQLAAGAIARIAEQAPRVVVPVRSVAPAQVPPVAPVTESIKADVVRAHLRTHGFTAPRQAVDTKPEVWGHKNGMEAALFDGGDSTADPTIYLVLKHNPQDAGHDAMASAINQQLNLHAWAPESVDAFGMDSALFEVWGAASVGVIVIHSTNKPWDKRHGHYSRSGIRGTTAAMTANQTVRKHEDANFYPTSAPAGNGGGKDADNTPLSAAQARANAAATCPACSGTRTFTTPCACGIRLGGRLAPGSPPPRAKRVRPDELAPKDPNNSYGTTPAASTMDGGYLGLISGPNK